MEFQINPEAKQLILNRGSHITVSIEREECYSCAGQVVIPYLSARLGRPNDSQVDEYDIVPADDIRVYVHKGLNTFDISSAIFALELSDARLESKLNETLVIYGVANKPHKRTNSDE